MICTPPKSVVVPVTIPWYIFTTIEEQMEKYQWSFEEAFYYLLDEWARFDRWRDDEEVKKIWESMFDYERERARDIEPAIEDYRLEFEWGEER